jgi:hypothetical protein
VPRLNRYTVEFPIPSTGRSYRAAFTHEHSSEGTITLVGTQDRLAIQHVTTCTLAPVDANRPEQLVEGVSWCSVKDPYDWRRGNKLALTRALAKLSIVPGTEAYGQAMQAYHRELRTPAAPQSVE